MATNAYYRTALTGGGVTALDAIDGATLNDGDFALCSVSGDFYVYKCDTTSGLSESSPYVITPDTNAGTIAWIQQSVPWSSDTGEMFLSSNLVKDPQRMPWNVSLESMAAVFGYASSTYGTPRLMTSSEFWTLMAAAGDTAQVTIDDTYATITNVTSGAGVLTQLILPGVTAGSDIATVKVTVDGTAYTLAFTAENATDRFFASPVTVADYYYSNQYASTQAIWQNISIISGLAWRRNASSVLYTFLKEPTAGMGSSPCIRFETSLKVEMKSSDFSTTSYRDYGAAIYTLDQY